MGYTIAILLYSLLIKLASLFNEKARKFTKGRQGLFENLLANYQPGDRKVAWFHCASLGEFEQGRPVIEKYKQEFEDHFILLTFYSPSGYELRKDYKGADYICYLPMDTPAKSKKFIEMTQPDIAFFVKYEFWPNYLKILIKKGIPVISFSTIFRKDQAFFKWYGGPYRNILNAFSMFFLQNKASAELLEEHSISNYTITGDTRFDRVAEIAANPQSLPLIQRFKAEKKFIVVGSSWTADLDLLIPFINNDGNNFKVIIAPHEIHESHIQSLIGRLSRSVVRYSEINVDNLHADVLIIDSIGLLSSIYQFADLAYIGGAFGKGLHNTLEAVIFNTPVIFGNKNYEKFQEAVDMIELDLAWPVGTTSEFEYHLKKYMEDEEFKIEIQSKIKQYIEQNMGATDHIISYCKTLV